MRSYLIDFLPVLRRTLQRDGFTVDHIRYFSNALKPWIVSRDVRTEGHLILRRDPRDLSRVYVLDPFDGSWLEVPYRTLSRPSITLWEHRAARRRAQERNAATVDENSISVTPKGRMFVRAVGMVFDKYLAQQTSAKYSKLI